MVGLRVVLAANDFMRRHPFEIPRETSENTIDQERENPDDWHRFSPAVSQAVDLGLGWSGMKTWPAAGRD